MTQKEFLHQLLYLPAVQEAMLSPDGRWAAFTWYRVHDNVDVFLVPTNGKTSPIALSHTPEYTDLIAWTADSKSVILSEDHDGDERVRLFRVDLQVDGTGRASPSGMQPLTEDSPHYFLRGGSLSPDGRTLFYGANYDFVTGSVLEPTWIYRHDLVTGDRTALARPESPAYTVPVLNLAGTHLLYARKDRHPAGRQYHLVDVEGKQDKEILYFGDRFKVFAYWFPDSEHILFISEATEHTSESGQEYMSLGIYHWPSDTIRWLVDDPHRAIEGAWVSPDGAVVVDEVKEAVHRCTFLLPHGGKWDARSSEEPLERRFPSLPGNLLPLGRSADGAWVAMYYSSTLPAELVRFTLDDLMEMEGSASLTRVWDHTSLRQEELCPAQAIHWDSEDGQQIQGWLYQATPNQRRAVIEVHGGPTYHTENRIDAEIQYLVARGFNVLDVNYRGSTGFGRKFREMIKEDGWGGREQADIATAARALIQAGLAEPGKIGVTGTSYGGYSAWFQITHTPVEVIAAAAPICGMTDLVVDYQTTRPDLRPFSEEMIGGSPDQVPERYFERSPINFVQNIRGKLLIVQGAQDPNVTPENVRQVRERLDANQVRYELLVFEDEGHGIVKLANQGKLYARLADFFDAALN